MMPVEYGGRAFTPQTLLVLDSTHRTCRCCASVVFGFHSALQIAVGRATLQVQRVQQRLLDPRQVRGQEGRLQQPVLGAPHPGRQGAPDDCSLDMKEVCRNEVLEQLENCRLRRLAARGLAAPAAWSGSHARLTSFGKTCFGTPTIPGIQLDVGPSRFGSQTLQ